MRYIDTFGEATRSGAKRSEVQRQLLDDREHRRAQELVDRSLRALNHSRSLLRFSARRNVSAVG